MLGLGSDKNPASKKKHIFQQDRGIMFLVDSGGKVELARVPYSLAANSKSE